ncbi:MAG TPA: hypothetical protein VF765_23305 [Polyangiaceae bacterium]
MRWSVACLLAAVVAAACSRSDLELERAPAVPGSEPLPEAGVTTETGPGPMSACPGPATPPAPCSEWRVAGSDTIVSNSTTPPGSGVYLTALVPSGNGALVSWFTISDPSAGTWDTRALNLDGTPRSAIVSHLSFPTMGGVFTDVMSLAVTPQCAFGGLVDDVASGCRFLPLDGDGNESGPVVSLSDATSGGCTYLGAAPDGFSYLQESPANGGPIDLVDIGTDGSFQGRAHLGPLPGFGTRVVLQDQTSLIASFFENDSGVGPLTEQVAHYDAKGAPLSPPLTLATNSGSILLMAQTAGHVVGAYIGDMRPMGEAVYAVAIDGEGASIGAGPQALDPTGRIGPIYGFSLDPLPSGDALLTWNELDENSTRYHLFAMELDPTGNPRQGVTNLGIFEDVANVRVIGGADGERALLVYSGMPMGGTGGVHAQPLACARH